jgi:hypothetical protein
MGYDMKATSRSRKARHGWPTGGHSSAVPKLALRPYGAAEDLVAGHRAIYYEGGAIEDDEDEAAES